MNIGGTFRICLLAVMLVAFFISNGITGGLGASSCSGSGTCTDNGCNGGNRSGGYADCCVNIGGCVCTGMLIGSCLARWFSGGSRAEWKWLDCGSMWNWRALQRGAKIGRLRMIEGMAT